jgi:hypothetical protein
MANQTATPYAPLLKSLKKYGREGMAHEFIGNTYGTDGYRLWYEDGATLPEKLARIVNPDQPANVATWHVTKEVVSFLGIAKKAHAHHVRFTADGLAFGGHSDEVTGKNHAPLPVVVDDVGLDPAYLLETLNYLLQGKKQGTLTVWLGREDGIGPWYISNHERHALIMPVKIHD